MRDPTKKVLNGIKKARLIVRENGVLEVGIRVLKKTQERQRRKTKAPKSKVKISFLAKYEDIIEADWSSHPYIPKRLGHAGPYTINWVMSPPGKGEGGGHQNMFRFIAYLTKVGYTCNAYLYSSKDLQPVEQAQAVFDRAHPGTGVAFARLEGPMVDADAVFATGWETAYPVFNDPGNARKFYFVQDFEPFFHPVGSEYILAENTYHFNFYGITAGGWLAKKLHQEYGMKTDHYDFGADKKLYRFENKNQRKSVFFYARPVTTRRGFELGVMALSIFHNQHPDYEIILAGWDVSDYHLPFPNRNLKTLKLEELSDVYNQCAAALVISLTNMSLMPLELLAAGTIPIVNSGPNNSEVSNNPYISYADASPSALAHALHEVVSKKDLPAYAEKAAASVDGLNWDESCAKFEKILRRELHG